MSRDHGIGQAAAPLLVGALVGALVAARFETALGCLAVTTLVAVWVGAPRPSGAWTRMVAIGAVLAWVLNLLLVPGSPIRWAGRSSRSSSRSRETARCAPRLVSATAWTSSTMTVSTPRNASRAELVSSRNSDSGVVMRMSVGRRVKARRSSAGVSPDRMPTWISGRVRPSRAAA